MHVLTVFTRNNTNSSLIMSTNQWILAVGDGQGTAIITPVFRVSFCLVNAPVGRRYHYQAS